MTAISYTSSSEAAIYIPQLASDPSTNVNDLLQLLIPRVSRQIDNYTKRRFYSSTAAEVRLYNGVDASRFIPPLDIASTSGLILQIAFNSLAASSGTYTTIAATDYNLGPDQVRDGWPHEWIDLTDIPAGNYSTSYAYTQFPLGANVIKLTSFNGWGTTAITGVPDDIRNVATELLVRAWRSKDMNFSDVVGLQGLGTATFSRRMPGDLADVLESYTRQAVG